MLMQETIVVCVRENSIVCERVWLKRKWIRFISPWLADRRGGSFWRWKYCAVILLLNLQRCCCAAFTPKKWFGRLFSWPPEFERGFLLWLPIPSQPWPVSTCCGSTRDVRKKALPNSGDHANKRPNIFLLRTLRSITESLVIPEWNDIAVFWAPEATASSVSQSGTEESNSLPFHKNSLQFHSNSLTHTTTLSHTLLLSHTHTTIVSCINNYTLSRTLLYSLAFTTISHTTMLSHIHYYL